MSNKTELQSNNLDLQAILDTVNNLPENPSAPVEIKLQEKTVMPASSAINITPDAGYDGLALVKVEGDKNLQPENIANGVSIFGIDGTHVGDGSSASVETCTVSIVSDIECDVNYVTVTEDDKLMLSSHFQQVDMGEQCKDYVVAKGTILTASDAIGHIIGGNIVSVVNTTGDVYLLIDSTEAWAFEVYGDGTITIDIPSTTSGGAS